MLTWWKLFNFKSVSRETPLELGPVTVLSGINSSGKSTLIQSMLLVSQTLSSNIPSRSVVLNGQMARLGQFDDLRSYGGNSDQILVGLRVQPQQGEGGSNVVEYTCEFSFDARSGDALPEVQQLQPGLFGFSLSAQVRTGPGFLADVQFSVNRSPQPYADPVGEVRGLPAGTSEAQLRESLNFHVALDDALRNQLTSQMGVSAVEPVGCFFRHFLPERLVVRYNSTERNARRLTSFLINSMIFTEAALDTVRDMVIPATLLDLLREELEKDLPFLADWESDHPMSLAEWHERVNSSSVDDFFMMSRLKELRPKLIEAAMHNAPAQPGLEVVPLPKELAAPLHHLEKTLARQLRYLGPLRDEPKAVYPLAPTAVPDDVGLRGEYTAAVLDRYKSQIISYLPPDRFTNKDGTIDAQPINRTLQTAVREWLQYMGVVDDVHTTDKGKLGHEMKVTTAGTPVPHDLTHVGVGVSQVLPIVVACLLADRDTTMIFEQPELHLHPRVQSLLGDFFLSMALLGKQCILESHSEYLVSRLRYRAAASRPDEDLSRLMRVYFVEKQQGVSEFTPVTVNQYGAVDVWPKDFFDQSPLESERILRAAAQKRKAQQRREKPND